MSHDWIADANFFTVLDQEDARVVAAAQAGGCLVCTGRLHRADYPRKPRGGLVGAVGEVLGKRRSLCCAREGCRKRQTPPSLVFLGRRVYLAIAVVVATWRSALQPPTAPMATPPRRTVRRWLAWFAWEVPRTAWYAKVRARLAPSLDADEALPGALVERFLASRSPADAWLATLRLMAPLSSGG